MKTCSKCKEEKLIEEFNKNKSHKDGLSNCCRKCSKQYSKDYYSHNESYRRKQIERSAIAKRNGKFTQAKYKKMVYEIKLDMGCVLCGENEPCCIDFHHFRGIKKFSLSAFTQRSKKSICEELDKCTTLCANCHRKLHSNILKLNSEYL